MPRKPKDRDLDRVVDLVAERLTDDADEPVSPMDEAAEAAAALSDGSGKTFYLHTKAGAYCFPLTTPDELQVESIAARVTRAGDYRVRVKQGRRWTGEGWNVTIDEAAIRDARSRSGGLVSPAPDPGTIGTPSYSDKLEIARLQGRLEASTGGGGASHWMTPEGLTAIASVVGALFAGMRNLAGGDSVGQLRELLKLRDEVGS